MSVNIVEIRAWSANRSVEIGAMWMNIITNKIDAAAKWVSLVSINADAATMSAHFGAI